MSINWNEEPAAIVGLTKAALEVAVAGGLAISSDQSASIVAAVTAIATVTATFFVRSKVTSPATVKAQQEATGRLSAKLATAFVTPFGGNGVSGYGHGIPSGNTVNFQLTAVDVGELARTRGQSPQLSGIHAHPYYKTGLKPHGKTDDQLLALNWAAGVPAYEPKVDRLSTITIGLDDNDKFGDCGPTSVDNHGRVNTKTLTGTEVDTAIDDVFDLYRRSGNPKFDPTTDADDNGVDMATMLAAVKSGGLDGPADKRRKIVAYARLKDISDESICAAIDLFGAVLFAVDLQVAQQAQSDAKSPYWDYVARSGDWGGHAIVAARYDSTTGDVWVGSWGMQVRTTKAFRAHRLQEVWVPLWPEILGDTRFVQTVDVATLAADFQGLTDATFPEPTPVPVPTPTPVDTDTFPAAVSAVAGLDAWLVKNGAKKSMNFVDYAVWKLAGDAGLRK